MKVLVADDNPAIRRVECHVLKEAGFHPLEARNGQHVIEILEREKVDVILLDIMMPLMDGFTVCKTIKENARWNAIPVIMVSAKDNKDDIIRARMVGADDYILKPFTKETVSKKVRKALIPKDQRLVGRPGGPERRMGGRTKVSWEVSWGASKELGLGTMYKNRVVNISPKGFAFEFDRCQTCTGYELSTVHPMCLLARHGKRFDDSEPLEFVLSIERDVVIEVRGKIAHIHQPPDWPTSEVVGVSFTDLTVGAEQILAKYTY